jgi:acyl-coenzyme A synthetase/AMP-(fatty) acid ligase
MIVLITNSTMIEEIETFITKKTGIFHQVFTVKYVKEISRNETGKIVIGVGN